MVLLAGCHKKAETKPERKTQAEHSAQSKSTVSQKKQQSHTDTQEPVKQATTNTTSVDKNAIWNQDRAEALQVFMKRWGAEMGQTYHAYGPGNDTDFFGLHYPSDFSKNQTMFEQTTPVFTWSKDGSPKSEFNVVAIYADVVGNVGDGHLYFFVIYDDQMPAILVHQQTGPEQTGDGKVHFTASSNEALMTGFNDIVAGRLTTEMINQQNKSKITPLTYEEAIDIINQLGFGFHDGSYYNYSDTVEYGFPEGTDHMPYGSNGIVVGYSAGAKGFDKFYLTPNADGTVNVKYVAYNGGVYGGTENYTGKR